MSKLIVNLVNSKVENTCYCYFQLLFTLKFTSRKFLIFSDTHTHTLPSDHFIICVFIIFKAFFTLHFLAVCEHFTEGHFAGVQLLHKHW